MQAQETDRPTYVRLTEEQREALEVEAREQDRSVSYILRRVVQEHIDARRAA